MGEEAGVRIASDRGKVSFGISLELKGREGITLACKSRLELGLQISFDFIDLSSEFCLDGQLLAQPSANLEVQLSLPQAYG